MIGTAWALLRWPARATAGRWRENAWHIGAAVLTLAVAAVLAWPLYSVVSHGAGVLSLDFITTAPANAGRAGGIAPILVSTALIVGVSLVSALPLAFCAAVLLHECLAPGHALAVMLRGSLDALAGVPSIVFGLFGLSFFKPNYGLQRKQAQFFDYLPRF